MDIFKSSYAQSLKTEFLLIGLSTTTFQNGELSLSMTPTVTLSSLSSRNLGVLFDSNLSPSDSDHISSIIKSCLLHVKDHASDLFLTKPLLAILQRIRSNSF